MRPHLSINVKNVTNSVDFYKKVFGVNPQKQNENYAKFDLKEPAFNFTMQTADNNESRVGHLGIEVDSAEEVLKWQTKLEGAGVLNKPELQTDCCFALQDKIWFQDPDGNAWEIFFVHKQLEVTGEINKSEKSPCCTPKFGTLKSSCC